MFTSLEGEGLSGYNIEWIVWNMTFNYYYSHRSAFTLFIDNLKNIIAHNIIDIAILLILFIIPICSIPFPHFLYWIGESIMIIFGCKFTHIHIVGSISSTRPLVICRFYLDGCLQSSPSIKFFIFSRILSIYPIPEAWSFFVSPSMGLKTRTLPFTISWATADA